MSFKEARNTREIIEQEYGEFLKPSSTQNYAAPVPA